MTATQLIALVTAVTLAAAPGAIGAADVSPAAPPSLQGVSAEAQATAFRDVPPNSAAYKAIQTLEAAGLIKGYPDGTFKGQRPLTRYEAAIITERVVTEVENRIQQAQIVASSDLAALRTLLTTFRTDIDTLNRRVDQIDNRVRTVEGTTATLQNTTATLQSAQEASKKDQDALKKEQSQLAEVQKRQQFGVLYFLRAPGTFTDAVAGYSAAGAPLPAGTTLVTNTKLGSGVNTSQNTLTTGYYQQGTGYQVLRAFFDGDANPQVSYHFRLENRLYFDNAGNNGSSNGSTGTSSTAPNYCNGSPGSTITTCGNNYAGNATLRLNYANVVLKNAEGFSATLGRYLAQNDALGLNYSDYFNGVQLGYARGRWNASAGYSFNFAALSNGTNCGTTAGSPSCTASGQSLFASGGYAFSKRLNAQLSYITDINPQLTLWNPAAPIAGSPVTGLYQAANVPISTGSLFFMYDPSPLLRLQVEGLHRFGNDPFTGRAWQQADALWASAQYGRFGGGATPRRGYLEGGYISAGFNSTNGHTNVNGTTNYQQFYLGNPNGYNMGYAAVHYWLSAGFRMSLGWLGYDLLPGTTIPGSSPTCPGCYITHDSGNAFFLQSLLQF